MKKINFFAVFSDIAPLLAEVESKRSIKYVLAESADTPEIRMWSRGEELPELGHADGSQSVTCRTYLIADKDLNVISRHIVHKDCSARYDVDQLLNPDTVVFTPAGDRNGRMIIAGSFGTASDSSTSQALMALIASSTRKRFTKVKSYWVGPEALSALRQGKRLSVAEQSPPSLDLRAAE